MIRCAEHHARQYNFTNLPKSNANAKHPAARAINDRPYSIIDRVYDKLKFELQTVMPAVFPRAFVRYFCCSSQMRSTAMSAGLTPEIRPACPMDMGRISDSF